MDKPWTVYIALLGNGKFYVGMTQRAVDARLESHQAGEGARYTRAHELTKILWTEMHGTAEGARKREKQLKGWTHAKKQALIDGDIAKLKVLAKARKP